MGQIFKADCRVYVYDTFDHKEINSLFNFMYISAYQQGSKIKKVYSKNSNWQRETIFISKHERKYVRGFQHRQKRRSRTQYHLQHETETLMHFRALQVMSQESDNSNITQEIGSQHCIVEFPQSCNCRV